MGIGFCLLTACVGCPLWFFLRTSTALEHSITDNKNPPDLEQTQYLYLIEFVKCEAVVDASWNNKKITR